MKIPLFW